MEYQRGSWLHPVRVMRLEIEGKWSAEEFGEGLSAISELYTIGLVLELMREEQRKWEHEVYDRMSDPQFVRAWARGPLSRHWILPYMPLAASPIDVTQLARLRQYVLPNEKLEVRRITYSSPGVADLAGIGVIVGHVKDFILKIIEHFASSERRELENQQMRIENAAKFVALARDLGFSDVEVRKLVAYTDDKQDIIFQLVSERKLTKASIVENAQTEA